MAHCGGCGRDGSTRVVSTLLDGALVEKCNQCAEPGDADLMGAVMDPSDKKMWPDWIVNPKGYKKVGDTLVATDETKSDLQAEVDCTKDADAILASAIEKKRQFARDKNIRPLSQVEIDARVLIFRDQYEEQKIYQSARDAGLVLPQD